MLALSIRQPHIYGMIHLGKRFENRDDSRGVVPNVCRHVGPFLLHAAAGMTQKEFWAAVNAWRDDGRITSLQHAEMASIRKTLARGGIVGYAQAIGRVSPNGAFEGIGEQFDRPRRGIGYLEAKGYDRRWWARGGHALVLDDDVHELPFVECPGRLGMWRVPADVLRRLERAGHRFDRYGNLLCRSGDRWVTVL
jgi:hypothetical protein